MFNVPMAPIGWTVLTLFLVLLYVNCHAVFMLLITSLEFQICESFHGILLKLYESKSTLVLYKFLLHR